MHKRHHSCAPVLVGAIVLLAAGAAWTQTSAPALQIPPGFDVPAAMNALYGNYDPLSRISIFTAPTKGLEHANIQPGQKVNVQPFFIAAVPDSGQNQFLVATFAIPDGDYECHACQPLIGEALLKKSAGGWTVEASEKPDLLSGAWGVPPGTEVFQFGPHHFGIKLTNTDGGQGAMSTNIYLLVPWAGGFSNAFSDFVEEDNSGYCGTQAPSPCYAYHSDLKFVKVDNSDYYDLVIETSGTKLPSSGTGAIENMSGVKRLHFVDGKYIPANSQ